MSTFTYSLGDTTWEGFVGGLVETGPGRYNDDAGRCLVLVGTITPTAVDGAVTNPFSTPNFALIVDGQLVDSEVNQCDVDAIEAAGYQWILDAEVTQGTTYAFYDEFFIHEGATVEVLVAGSAVSGDSLYFDPTPVPLPQP